MRELLRRRDMRLLLTGQTLSMFGDTATAAGAGHVGQAAAGSGSAAGSVLAAVIVPSLLAPLGGLVIDRLPRHPLMVGVDVASAAVVLALLLVRDAGDLWLLYVVGFCYGSSMVLFESARSALLSPMLPEHLLGPANGSLGTVREALRLVGAARRGRLVRGLRRPCRRRAGRRHLPRLGRRARPDARRRAADRARRGRPPRAAGGDGRGAAPAGRPGAASTRRGHGHLHARHRPRRERVLRRGRRRARAARDVHRRPGGRAGVRRRVDGTPPPC